MTVVDPSQKTTNQNEWLQDQLISASWASDMTRFCIVHCQEPFQTRGVPEIWSLVGDEGIGALVGKNKMQLHTSFVTSGPEFFMVLNSSSIRYTATAPTLPKDNVRKKSF